MLARTLLLFAVSILVADALHTSSLAPALKSPGAMAAARLERTPTLHALRGGSDDAMAVNFVWFSCFAVAASAMVRDRVLVTCFGVEGVASSEFRPPPPSIRIWTNFDHLLHPSAWRGMYLAFLIRTTAQ